MIFVPSIPPLQQTRHSRELADRVTRVVREYQRDHPDVMESDVRTALLQSAPGESSDVARRRRAAGIAVAVACVAGFTVMASTGGGKTLNSSVVWLIIGAVAGAAGIAVALIRFTRRD